MKRPPRLADDYGLQKFKVRLTAREFVDFDYLPSLSDDERAWLARFSAEYYQSRFRNDETDFFARNSTERQAQYSANNARNRDMWHKFNRISRGIDPDQLDSWAAIAFSVGYL